MNDRELAELISDLQAAFPQQRLAEDSVGAYRRWLADLPAEPARQAVHELIQTSPTLPTIALIRSRAAQGALAIPSADDAYSEIVRGVRLTGRYRPQPEWSSPFLREIVRAFGGWAALCATELNHDEFTEVYARVRREALRSQVAA